MSDLIARALPVYELAEGTPLILLNCSENETWRAGPLILRLHRQGYHTKPEIASELAWLTALQDLPGLNTVRPIPGAQGLITEIGTRFLVAFAPIQGQELQPGDDLARWFAPLGEITARLHLHARASGPRPRASPASAGTWRPSLAPIPTGATGGRRRDWTQQARRFSPARPTALRRC
jgi:Ser/Thr protein kinase RdoA (MazF antagonist)